MNPERTGRRVINVNIDKKVFEIDDEKSSVLLAELESIITYIFLQLILYDKMDEEFAVSLLEKVKKNGVSRGKEMMQEMIDKILRIKQELTEDN